jgi:hypothetical protein
MEPGVALVGRKRLQVLLPQTILANHPLDPLQAWPLGAFLAAAAQHAKQLEEAATAAAGSFTMGTDTTGLAATGQQQSGNSSMGNWRQVLGSEQGWQLPQALMDVGSLLCAALPSRFCCNEPSCCFLEKPSEVQSVGGKGTKCSGCWIARYCSVAHQRLHWKKHKPACRAVAAAVAAESAKVAVAAAATPQAAGRPIKS